jgi:hypothetical protein
MLLYNKKSIRIIKQYLDIPTVLAQLVIEYYGDNPLKLISSLNICHESNVCIIDDCIYTYKNYGSKCLYKQLFDPNNPNKDYDKLWPFGGGYCVLSHPRSFEYDLIQHKQTHELIIDGQPIKQLLPINIDIKTYNIYKDGLYFYFANEITHTLYKFDLQEKKMCYITELHNTIEFGKIDVSDRYMYI